MAELAVRARFTFDDARHLSGDEFPGELVQGEWIPVTRTTGRHGQIMTEIAYILRRYLEDHPIGRVASGDAGVELAHDPDTLRGPDLAFFASERLADGNLPDEWWDGAPDLAIEIVSRSQTLDDMVKRAGEYLAAGARVAWVVDPKARAVCVLSPLGLERVVHANEELGGGDVLPGFRCRARDFFA